MSVQPIGSFTPQLAAQAAKNAAEGGFTAEMEKAAAAAKEAKQDDKLRKTCRDMEAVFLNMMWGRMRATVSKSGLMGDNNSKIETMQSMLDSEMTKKIAQGGGMGLGDMLYQQLHMRSTNESKTNGQAPK